MKKITLFTASIDTKAIIKQLADYKQSLEQLKVAQKGLDTSTVKGAEQFVKNQVAIKKTRAESNKYEKVLIQLESNSKGLLSANKSLERSLKVEVKTINQARESNKKLLAIRNNLNLNSKEGISAQKKINNQLDKNNAFIQKNVAGLEKQKINIGNYGGAVGKLTGMLKRLGGAFAVFGLIKNSFKIVKEFEQSQANLASVLGVNTDEMAGLTEQAKELGATTTFTASQVAQLALEFAKLGFTQTEIQGMTEATLALAEATGSELGEAASVVGATMRGFGLEVSETQRVTDVMAKSFSSSSLDMAKFSTAMASVAPVANLAGVGLEKTTALLGTLTDRGIDASTAGTGLRNMFLRSNAAGLTFDEALEQVRNSTDQTAESMKLFGVRGATLGAILANTQEDVANLTESVTDSEGAAQKMADTQRDTLGGSIKLLQSAWEGLVLQFEAGTGVFGTVKNVILVLADNLGLIAKAAITVGVVWGTYKAAIVLARIQTSLMSVAAKLSSVAMTQQAKGVASSTLSWKAFNKALKANAIFLAIASIVAIVAALNKFNKSLGDTVKELSESNKEFVEQSQAALDLSGNLDTMAKRYDELKGKTELSKDEQIELNKIIKDIAKDVPDAVTEVDKYGNALEINTDKVKEFNKENGKTTKLKAEIQIEKQKKVLDELAEAQERVNKINKEGNAVTITGIGLVSKLDGVLNQVNLRTSKSGNVTKTLSKLTKEQQLVYEEYIKSLEDGATTTKKDIENNEDIIASVNGVKNARQIAADEEVKTNKKLAAELAALAESEKLTEEEKAKAIKKRLSDLRKALSAEVDISKLRLKILEKENKESDLLTGVQQAEIVRQGKLKILKLEEKEYQNSAKFKTDVEAERTLQYLKFSNERVEIDAEFVNTSKDIAIETSEAVIEEYRKMNGSRIKDSEFVSKDLFDLEAQRIDDLLVKEIEHLDSLELNATEHKARLALITQEADIANDENNQKRKDTLTEQELQDYENLREIRADRGNEEFELKIEELERLRAEELRIAEQTGADIALINEKYDNKVTKVDDLSSKQKVDNAAKAAGQISSIMKQLAGENKEIAMTAAIIDGALGIQSILAEYPKFDGGFAMVAAIAASAITTATSLSTIQKAEDGISFQGTLKGASHANGGINLGNGIEAEGGENMYTSGGNTHIVNKKASSLINRLGIMGALSYINQREGGGIALSAPTSYAQKGGLISTLGGGNVEIDYTKMAQAFEAGASRVQNTVNVNDINSANNNITQVNEFTTV